MPHSMLRLVKRAILQLHCVCTKSRLTKDLISSNVKLEDARSGCYSEVCSIADFDSDLTHVTDI